MVSPTDVANFHAEYDRHPDDRVRLFAALVDWLPDATRVLYPGSYIDIAPSVWFDEVVYVDSDDRARRFFGQEAEVAELVMAKRAAWGPDGEETPSPTIAFHAADYTEPLPIESQSVDLLVSLFAGFVSEHCTDYLRIGGHLLVNPSHGDVAMASIDERYELCAVVTSRTGAYQVSEHDLNNYLVPKKRQDITVERLHESGKGIAYTRSAFAYVFERVE
ncbi:MAG: hypothetical protein AAF567_07120 [Actinomycetota bacterium]